MPDGDYPEAYSLFLSSDASPGSLHMWEQKQEQKTEIREKKSLNNL